MKKNVAARCDFRAQNTPKCVRRGLRPDLTGRNYRAPSDLIAGFQGAAPRQGGKVKGEKEEKREGG